LIAENTEISGKESSEPLRQQPMLADELVDNGRGGQSSRLPQPIAPLILWCL